MTLFFPSDNENYLLNLSYVNKPYSYTLLPGHYLFSLLGASGGGLTPGYGAFVSGIIRLTKPQKLHFYIGQKGVNGEYSAFNGGGIGCMYGSSGGGATDIRLTDEGSSDSFESLKSRIIVAGGGGGSQSKDEYQSQGGSAGILCGDNGKISGSRVETITKSTGGTQTQGGIGGKGYDVGMGENGTFGCGGRGSIGNANGNGGGGGYFGGGGSGTNVNIVGSGAGGSSYVSGYSGCKSIKEYAQENSLSPSSFTESSIHYSCLYFTTITVKSGEEIKWNDNGQITVRFLGNLYINTYHRSHFIHLDLIYILIAY